MAAAMMAAAALVTAAARSPATAPLTLHRKIRHVFSNSVGARIHRSATRETPRADGLVAFTQRARFSRAVTGRWFAASLPDLLLREHGGASGARLPFFKSQPVQPRRLRLAIDSETEISASTDPIQGVFQGRSCANRPRITLGTPARSFFTSSGVRPASSASAHAASAWPTPSSTANCPPGFRTRRMAGNN